MSVSERVLETLALPAGARCKVARDSNGVAVVTAEDLAGAQFGLGYCHARDRGLQMLMARIIGRGRACEQLQDTDELLELDRFMRRWNFRADAAREEIALSPGARAMARNYCDGVNLYFARHRVPWELRWLGYRFEPWILADVFVMAKLAGFVGLAHTQAVLERFIVECVQNGLSRDRLEGLFPGQLQGLDEELLRHVRLPEQVIPATLKWGSALPSMFASNNWVISGRKTASGKPFLCNDPHLEVSRLPAVWYEAVLRWNEPEGVRYAMGGTLPGVPGVVFGRTPNLAWGVTYGFMDTIDSWVEECRAGHYRRGQRWLPFVVRKEVVRRKKHPPQEFLYHENDHGVLDGNPTEAGFYLATRWACGQETSAAALEAAHGILRASNVQQGRQCLGNLSNASWNWVLADGEGNIGYQMSGRMPRRRPGLSGLVPVPGWDSANDWQGFESTEDLPRALNPAEGFIATANEDRNHLGKVRPINAAMADYRASRISEALRRAESLTLEDMKALQLDLRSTQAQAFMPIIRPLLAEFTDARAEAARILAEWDMHYARESKGAFVFEEIYRALFEEVFGERNGGFGPDVLRWLRDETFLLVIFFGSFDQVLLEEDSPWFAGRSRTEIYRSALSRGLSVPPEPYAQRCQVRMRHLLLGGKLPLQFGFDRTMEIRGGRATVPQGQISHDHGRTSGIGASLRLVTDLATHELETALPGGPSDRRFSKWYVNDLAGWLAGEYKVIRGGPGTEAR